MANPWDYLGDEEVDTCDLLIIGCGNVLRGDDAVGPIIIRRLWEQNLPQIDSGTVRLSDGGTSGMDVAFVMRGAKRVIIIDAATTGAEPGTLFQVPGQDVEDLPPAGGIHSHEFRWDHALGFSKWLLGPYCPTDITVYLIEAGGFDYGGILTEPVDQAASRLTDLLLKEIATYD